MTNPQKRLYSTRPDLPPPEWSRREMILYGGVSWFYLICIWFTFQGAITSLADLHLDLSAAPIALVFCASTLLFLGCLGMVLGLFSRPAWRDWRWLVAIGCSFLGQLLYALACLTVWRLGYAGYGVWVDELAFAIWLGLGFARALFDNHIQTQVQSREVESPEEETLSGVILSED